MFKFSDLFQKEEIIVQAPEPEDYHELAWRKLPLDIKVRAVGRLKSTYSNEFFKEVAKLIQEKGLHDWLPDFWHFGQGMTVRNVLRSDQTAYDVNPTAYIEYHEIPDAELPPLDEYYGEGTNVRNWDDYYIQCVEAAAGFREL